MTISELHQPAARGSPRHPSSHRVATGTACARCGFENPTTADIAAAIAAIPDQWAAVLRPTASPSMLAEAARLRDELHVVTNRISRVLAVPGSAVLAPVRIGTPTSWSRTADPDQLIALLRMAAERLTGLVRSLRSADWHLSGRIGRRSLSIRDLTLVPLHRSHARLTRGQTCK